MTGNFSFFICLIWDHVILSLLFVTVKTGLQQRPESVITLTSLSCKLWLNPMSKGNIPDCFNFLNLLITSIEYWVLPNHNPFTIIFILRWDFSSINSLISLLTMSTILVFTPKLIWVNKHIFFTNPHPSPSGVSVGSALIQLEVWSCLGFAKLPSLEMGAIIRRKWLNMDTWVRRCITWLTPFLVIFWRFTPQFPVLIEYMISFVIWSWLIASVILRMVFPESFFSVSNLKCFSILWRLNLNKLPNKLPVMSNRLFPKWSLSS